MLYSRAQIDDCSSDPTASIKENLEGEIGSTHTRVRESNRKAATMETIFNHFRSCHPQASAERVRRMSIDFLVRYHLSVTHDGRLSWDNIGRYGLLAEYGRREAGFGDVGRGEELSGVDGEGILRTLRIFDKVKTLYPLAGDEQIRRISIVALHNRHRLYDAHGIPPQGRSGTSSSNAEILVKEESPEEDVRSDHHQVLESNDIPSDMQELFSHLRSPNPYANDERIWRKTTELLEHDNVRIRQVARQLEDRDSSLEHSRSRVVVKEECPNESRGDSSSSRVLIKQETPEQNSPNTSSPRTLLGDTTPTPCGRYRDPLGSANNEVFHSTLKRARIDSFRCHRQRTHPYDDSEPYSRTTAPIIKQEPQDEDFLPMIKSENTDEDMEPTIKHEPASEEVGGTSTPTWRPRSSAPSPIERLYAENHEHHPPAKPNAQTPRAPRTACPSSPPFIHFTPLPSSPSPFSPLQPEPEASAGYSQRYAVTDDDDNIESSGRKHERARLWTRHSTNMEKQLADLSGACVAGLHERLSLPQDSHDPHLQSLLPAPPGSSSPARFSPLQPDPTISPFSTPLNPNPNSYLDPDASPNTDADKAAENNDNEDEEMDDSDKENEHAGETSAGFPGTFRSNPYCYYCNYYSY